MPFRIAIRRRVAKCPTSDLADFRMVDETVERIDSGDSPPRSVIRARTCRFVSLHRQAHLGRLQLADMIPAQSAPDRALDRAPRVRQGSLRLS